MSKRKYYKLNEWHTLPIDEKKEYICEKLKIRDNFIKFKRYFDLHELSLLIGKDYDSLIEEYAGICDTELNVIVHLKPTSMELIEERIRLRKDFLINPYEDYTTIKDIKSMDEIASRASIYSFLYGPFNRHKDDKIHDRFYTCDCETIMGKYNLKVKCDECGTEVKEKEFSPEIIGWIDLECFRIPTYIGRIFLKNILTSGIVERLFEKKQSVRARNTKREEKKPKEINNAQKKLIQKFRNPYIYDNMKEIFESFLTTKRYEAKRESIEFFLKHKDEFFTKYIPVISTSFRRFSASTSFNVTTFFTNRLNSMYTMLSDNAKLLLQHRNDESLSFKYYSLLYKTFRTLCTEDIFRDILSGSGKGDTTSDSMKGKGKFKFIRSKLTSGPQDNTIMAVIEPTRTFRSDQIKISYNHIIALFTDKLKDYCKKTGIRYQTTMQLLNLDIDKTTNHKKILNDFLKTGRFFVWFNRQPTVKMSSNIMLEVVGLHDLDIMQIHPILCTYVAGDYDGDAPSAKGLVQAANIDLKMFFYMNMANYNRDYKGDFTGEGLPINDMGILNKISVPSTTLKGGKINLGFNHICKYDKCGELISYELNKMSKHIPVDIELKDSYEEKLKDELYIVF